MIELKYIPNFLSFFRLFCGPVIFLLLIDDFILYKWFALVFFFIGSLSDALDGYFARTYNWTSEFGKNIDPFADKIFILSALFALFVTIPEYVPFWMILVVVFRDVLVTFIRFVSKRQNIKFKTSNFAKLKTIIQSISIHLCIFIIIIDNYYLMNKIIIYYVMFVSTAITFFTGLDYSKYYLKELHEK